MIDYISQKEVCQYQKQPKFPALAVFIQAEMFKCNKLTLCYSLHSAFFADVIKKSTQAPFYVMLIAATGGADITHTTRRFSIRKTC